MAEKIRRDRLHIRAQGSLVCLLVAWAGPAMVQAAISPLSIEHVNVLPMTAEGPALRDMTVIIRDGRIASISPSKQSPRAPDVTRIDGLGKWLMPGLTDMHVHLETEGYRRQPAPSESAPRKSSRPAPMPTPYQRPDDIFTPFVANGVLQVFDLQSTPETIGWRVEVESGRVTGPRIWLAAMIDGSPPFWPLGATRVATTAEDGRQVVRDIATEGYDFVKVYSNLNLETFSAIVDEARKLNIRVVGHIPQRGKRLTEKFFQPGYDLVAHAEEFAQQQTPPAMDLIPDYVAMSKRNSTWLIATLTADDRILEQVRNPDSVNHRPDAAYLSTGHYESLLHNNTYTARATPRFRKYMEDVVEFNTRLVRAFVAASIPILTGTDAGIPGVIPGYSLHDELEALAAAGVDNRRVLEGSTRLASEWLGVADDRGTVEAGKRADLLLLDADPLQDVHNTRRIAAVILGGQYLSRKVLDRRLSDLAAYYKSERASWESQHPLAVATPPVH